LLHGQRHDQDGVHRVHRDLRGGAQAGHGPARRAAAAAGEPRGGAGPRRRGGGPPAAAQRDGGPGHPGAGRSPAAPGAVRRGAAVTGTPPAKDAAGGPDRGLEAFVQAIEDHLRARRGVEHILSPRDFALARGWCLSGVPLATVLVGMDRAFESGADVTSLAYCRRWVEALAAAGPAPALRPAPAAESIPLGEVGELLEQLAEQLARVQPRPGFDPPLRTIREV